MLARIIRHWSKEGEKGAQDGGGYMPKTQRNKQDGGLGDVPDSLAWVPLTC